MLVLKNEGRRRKKIRYMEVKGRARLCHYRHGPCQLTGFLGVMQGMGWHGRATQARAVPSFWHFGLQIFFLLRFLESCSDNYLQNNLKQTKSD